MKTAQNLLLKFQENCLILLHIDFPSIAKERAAPAVISIRRALPLNQSAKYQQQTMAVYRTPPHLVPRPEQSKATIKDPSTRLHCVVGEGEFRSAFVSSSQALLEHNVVL